MTKIIPEKIECDIICRVLKEIWVPDRQSCASERLRRDKLEEEKT